MKILVVDDEPLARQRLVRLLASLQPDAETEEAANGESALALVAQFQPDVLLLDIRMPGMDGIAVAEQLETLPEPPAVVFCTAYDEYALEALRHEAVAYLLKPVREAELARALTRAGRVNRLQLAALRPDDKQGARTHVSSQGQRTVESLPVNEVRCFIAGQKYVTAYGSEQQLLLPDTLKDLELEFADSFVRVHRNALISLRYIQRLSRSDDGWVVELAQCDLRPAVSRRHLAAVKEKLVKR